MSKNLSLTNKKRKLSLLQRTYLKVVKEEATLQLKRIRLQMELEILKVKKRDAEAAALVQEAVLFEEANEGKNNQEEELKKQKRVNRK